MRLEYSEYISTINFSPANLHIVIILSQASYLTIS